MADDDGVSEKPELWHVQYADESRDCDGTYPLSEHYAWARHADDAQNRADEDFNTSEGISVIGQYDTRLATAEETQAWLLARISVPEPEKAGS